MGCYECHGTKVEVLDDGSLDPATWPNTGIGRLNPDGSRGSCTAGLSRHHFSVEQARNPENCGKCHMGPDHPQIEIYNESKHGIAFRANRDQMNLASPTWVVGEDSDAAPPCATCHMSAPPTQPVTHDVGLRTSWNNRPVKSIRPEVSDARMGRPGANLSWETRRASMSDVCRACHAQTTVDSFWTQDDGLIDMYHRKYADPGLALAASALCVAGVWVEKGLGLLVPGFIPTPLGDLVEHTPALTEIGVSAGTWAFGALFFTAVAKVAVAIQWGDLRA